jgi:hypothetical protein
MDEREYWTKPARGAERELDAATKARAASIVAIGYSIADTDATTYTEAVQRRETTFDQAAAEIRAKGSPGDGVATGQSAG